MKKVLCLFLSVFAFVLMFESSAFAVGNDSYVIKRNDQSVIRTQNGKQVTLYVYYDQIIVDLEKSSASNVINKEIKTDMDTFFRNAKEDAIDWFKSLDQIPTYSLYDCVGNKSIYLSNNMLSIHNYQRWYMGGINNGFFHCFNYDLSSGKHIRLPTILGLSDEDTLSLISAAIKLSVYSGAYDYWNREGNKYDYFINENGEIYLAFDAYAFSAGSQSGAIIPLGKKVDAQGNIVTCNSSNYYDVMTPSWYRDSVDYVTDKTYMTGVGLWEFNPSGRVSRAQVAQILYAMEGKPNSGKDMFSDVTAGAWYKEAVNWAANNGLVSGYGNGKFGPNDNVTRQQLVAILYKYAQYKKLDTATSFDITKYPDYKRVSGYAIVPMRWAVGHRIISGTNKGLDPIGTATRAQIAVILRAMDNL